MADRDEFGLVRRGPVGMTPGDLLTSPFGMMRRMAEEMNQLFENVGMGRFSPGQLMVPPAFSAPNVDVSETPDAYLVEAELPGVDEKDIDVQVTGESLVIRAHSEKASSKQDQGYHVSERRYGSFHRVIPLPGSINPDSAKARYRNGVLEITLPKAEQVRGHRIQVEGSEAGTQASPDAQATNVNVTEG